MAVLRSETTRSSVDIQVEENALEDPTRSTNPNHHTAFMQCRACCNCDGGCSYYGKGKFDKDGKYIGP